MNNQHNNPIDPWERDSFETGSTKPPKNRGGIIAVLLVAVIFLGGITSALGLMNVRLFGALAEAGKETIPMLFSTEPSDTGSGIQNSTQSEQTLPPNTGDITVNLNKSPESVENIPQSGGLSYQEIYSKNIDSVVSVLCTLQGGSSSGTGVVLSEKGYIVTNCHVVEGAQSIRIRLTDQRELVATIVGADTVSDLAVLYVNATDLKAAEFGDASSLRVGDAVAAIGDPLGVELRGTMTDGIVSAINRDMVVSGRKMTLIQTNAALNSGNSGGPLLNCYGQVIGINTMKIGAFADEAGVEGLGFAIPSTTVKEVVDQLLSQGYVSGRPGLGLKGEAVTMVQQHFYRYPAGVLVTEVTDGSNADTQGLIAGDILLSLDGVRITSEDEMRNVLYSHRVGDTVEAIIYRSGRQYSVTLTLEEARGA